MGEVKNFMIGLGLALVLVVGGYFLLVRKCNVIVPPGIDEARCKCLGKVVNIKLLLGNEDALELPKTEHCVGVVVSRRE